jgi:hypothetical protein
VPASRGRAVALALALAALGVAFFGVRPKPTAGPALRDFESYYAAGVAWGYHNDPYSRDVWRTERTIPGVVATRDELLPFVGPPFGLPLWNALGGLSWRAATVLWGTVMALSLATLAFASLRLGGGRIDLLDAIAVLVVAAGFGPLTSGVALGQAAIVSCAAIAAVPLLLGPRLVFGAAFAILLAGLQPNLAVALLARLESLRGRIALAFAATVAAGGSALALGGAEGIVRYVDVLRAHAASERFIAIQTTPAAVARALGASPALAGALAIGIAVVAIGATIAALASGRYAPNDRLALACAALPLALPFAHEHDFTIAFLPAVVAVRRARGGAWILAAVALLGVGVDWLGLAQRPTGAAQIVALDVAAALALVVLARDRLRPYHAFPLAVALAAAFAGAVAAHDPLATWPDALGAGFRAPLALGAPAVWHLEQLRSGIGRLDPLWGALRLASLASCALVWVGAAYALRASATSRTTPNSGSFSTRPRRPAVAYPSD